MLYMMAVTAKTARAAQGVGDIIGVFDYENGPTATEQELFEIVPMKKMSKAEVEAEMQKQLDEAKEYPKFPFSVTKITGADKAALDSSATPIADMRAIIKKITPKAPIGDVVTP